MQNSKLLNQENSPKPGASIPRTLVVRNRCPARDSRVARWWGSGGRAEVMYNSSRLAPRKAKLVGYVIGSLISRCRRQVGSYLATLALPQRTLYKRPSPSAVRQEGTPSHGPLPFTGRAAPSRHLRRSC